MKFLLVEDEPIAQVVSATNIRELGFDIDIAGSGEKALTLLQSNNYALIFMDIGLPDTTGFALTKKIHQEKLVAEKTPIVALTAHDDEDTRAKAKECGLIDFVVKPLTIPKATALFKKLGLMP